LPAGTARSRPRRSFGAAPWLIAIFAGVMLWLVAGVLSGQREPWDADAYWKGAYPAAMFVCAALGYLWPIRAWRWPLALFEAQLLGMWLRSGEIGNLWPLGMMLLAVLALPGVAVALLAAQWARAARSG
jgi:hypothetical protein